MSVYDVMTDVWEFNRKRTLATLQAIAELPDPAAVLGWRPGEGRAHIAWQLMHVGITEEVFATERLTGASSRWPDLVPRFKGGSTPDDNIPSIDQIRQVLSESRHALLQTIGELGEADLGRIPEALQERGWTIGMVLKIVSWHECHHQGQAHITLNLFKSQQ